MTVAVTSFGWFSALAVVVSAVYCVGSWALIAATPGQLILGVRVKGVDFQKRLTPRASALRWFFLFGIFGLIGSVEVVAKGSEGLLMMVQGAWLGALLISTLQSPTRQGLHDRFAGSVVVGGGLFSVFDAVLSSATTRGRIAGGVAPSIPAPQPQASLRIAGLGRRTAAYLLDLIGIALGSWIVVAIAKVPGMAQTTVGADGSTTTSYMLTSSGWSMVIVGIVSAAYCVVSWASMGGTPGQRLLGLRVSRSGSSAPLSVVAAVVRWALLWGVICLAGAPALLAAGLSSPGFAIQVAWLAVLVGSSSRDPKKRGLHDRLAGSVVFRDVPAARPASDGRLAP